MNEQKTTYIITPAEIRTIMAMAIEAGHNPNASGIHIVAEEFLIKECNVPLGNIMSVNNVKVVEGQNNGLPQEIVIEWTRTPRAATKPTVTQVQEWSREQADYIVAEIMKQMKPVRAVTVPLGLGKAYGLGSMPKMTVEDAMRKFSQGASQLGQGLHQRAVEALAKRIGDDQLSDLKIKSLADVTPEQWETEQTMRKNAEVAVTVLQAQLAEVHEKHANDNTDKDRMISKMRAEIRSMRDSYRHAPRSVSFTAAWGEVAAMNRTTARWIIASAYKLFDVAAPVDGFHLNIEQAKLDLPKAALHYIHGMCDNLLQVPAPKPVTMQQLKEAATRYIQANGKSTAKELLIQLTNHDRLPDVSESDHEALFEAFQTNMQPEETF